MMLVLIAALAVEGSLQETPEAMEPLKFLIGSWTGQGKLDNGDEYTDEQRFEWVHDRQFIKSEYHFKTGGKTVHTATSIIGYDHEKKRVFAFVFSRTGASGRTELVNTEKDRFVFEGRVSGPGVAVDDRVTHTKIDDDTFSVTVEQKKDGKFTETGKYVYRRKK